ncbi:hypothetical protein AB0D32_26795 [Micromonospora sp. NPDC048170]|uniref:hypothetical protein n=1 Tax=Micromonospora sp. NPDC048170 TaxID=3154819 RepID=UPI0033F31760
MGLLDSLRNRRAVKDLELKRWANHTTLLEIAAGLSTAVMMCHDDTWQFVERQASSRDHWRSPEPVSVPGRKDPMVEVRLSGPQLAAVIEALARLAGIPHTRGAYSLGTVESRAIARRVYIEIREVLKQYDPDNPDAAIPAIVLDDQVGTATGEPGAR